MTPELEWPVFSCRIADSIFLFRVAENSYQAGTVLDALWPAGLVMLGYAAWSRLRDRHEVRFEGLATIVLPCVFAASALLLLIQQAHWRALRRSRTFGLMSSGQVLQVDF